MRRVLARVAVLLLVLAVAAPAGAGPGGRGRLTHSSYTQPHGLTRGYLLYVPAALRPGAPLVVYLHGCNETATQTADASHFNRIAAQRGFVVAYPQQNVTSGSSAPLADGNGIGCWNWFLPQDQNRGTGEPAVIAGITEQVTRTQHVDPRRVYVEGVSAGADMAVILGATYPDLYSAVAAHSAPEYQAATDIPSALAALTQGGPNPVGQGQQAFAAMGDHARLMPVLVVQGIKDPRVNPVNGDQVIQQWLETNRLATGGMFTRQFATPTTDTHFNEATPGGHPYRVRTWTDDHARIIHEYWTIDGMGHAWSGGYWLGSFADPRGPNVTRIMYSFFSSTISYFDLKNAVPLAAMAGDVTVNMS